MADVQEIAVTIEILSPTHLSSGKADVTVDAEIIHDVPGFPYFPAKRFKGLLYESAVEVLEMFDLSGLDKKNLPSLDKIFHRQSSSEVQLIVPNFFILPIEEYQNFCTEWKYLQTHYQKFFTPKDILTGFTSLRYQTKLTDGVAEDGSLRNLRVMDEGTKFFGTITLLNGDDGILNLLALAIKNLSAAGMKRNRGFGRIKCTANFGGTDETKLIRKFFAEVA